MKAEFDISKCSNRFIYELATLVDSEEILKEITDCAINIKHYDDQGAGFDIDEDFYLDAVVSNPNTSLESILAIIKYPNATYSRWSILEKLKLDNVHIEQFAKFEKDFSLLCILMEKYQITSQLADVIASRLINNEIEMTKLANDDYAREDVINQNIEFIIHKCSDEWKAKLKEWYSNNSALDRKFDNMLYMDRFGFLHDD